MTYVALPNPKKNGLSTTISGNILIDAVTIPVTECAVFYDDAAALILEGIVISRNNAVESATEEIKITGCSAASGAGNLTGVTRAVSADGSNGAASAWEAGTLISVGFTSTLMKRIGDDLADLNTNKIAKTANITALNETGIADGEIAVFNLTNKDIRTSDKTIVTTLGADDTTVPTSKAVIDSRASKSLPSSIKWTAITALYDLPPTMGGTGATIGYQKMTNGIVNAYLEFQNDVTQYAFFEGVFDKDWDTANLTAILRWYTTSADVNQVVWKLYGIRYTDAASRDIAVSTLKATITQSNTGALFQNVTTETAAFTLAGTGRNFVLMLTRDYAAESPSLAAYARFLNLEIYNTRVLV